MHACASIPIESLVSLAGSQSLPGELEERLPELATLAFRVAYSVLRRREDAEDVAQETLARACRRHGEVRERLRLRGWVARIAWRLALDHQRSGRRRERRELRAVWPAPEPSVHEVAERNEFREHLWRAIDTLPEKLRIVLVLSAIEEYDVAEVAALLGLPDGTVKSRLHHARRRLAEVLS
jgi:RNA polymerase sigma-70 factor, ECF subfamily